jgi:D-psicose/D-tagatose/L-ribulose 3-epimerase
MMTTIGWCARIEQADRVQALGYDFIEVALAPMKLEDDACFAAAKAAIVRTGCPRPVYNQFLPPGLLVIGPEVHGARVRRYLARVAEVVRLGSGEIVVFGSGWARNVPHGWSRELADRQFLEMIGWCVEAFAPFGITLALESQNHTETNYMTTLGGAVEIAEHVARPSVRVITDTYHLHMEQEPLTVITSAFPQLAHVHVSDSERHLPGDGVYDFRACFRHLHELGYERRLSIEMMREVTDEEMRRSLAFVQNLWRDTR